MEVKTGRYRPADLAGLFELCRGYRELTPLLLCDPGREPVARQAGIEVMTWHQYLLQGPPPAGEH